MPLKEKIHQYGILVIDNNYSLMKGSGIRTKRNRLKRPTNGNPFVRGEAPHGKVKSK